MKVESVHFQLRNTNKVYWKIDFSRCETPKRICTPIMMWPVKISDV